MQTTIVDVAERAEVSTATVSRVLNQNENGIPINEDTKEKVLKAVEELGYKPNHLARGFVRGKTETLGIVFPDVQSLFMLKILEEKTRQQGYNVMFSVSEDRVDLERQCCETFIHRRVDGIIISPIPSKESNAQYLNRLKVPSVLINEALPGYTGPSVLIDNDAGGKQAVEHLINLGHKQIAFIGGPTWITGFNDRLSGYKRAHKNNGLSWNEAMIEIVQLGTVENGYSAMRKLLKNTEKPTALFCVTDMLAIGAMKAIHDCGLKVPDDISVIGFDDIEIGSYLDVPLTTMYQGRDKIAELAVNMLIDMIVNKRQPEQRNPVIEPKLIIRNSCAKRSGV